MASMASRAYFPAGQLPASAVRATEGSGATVVRTGVGAVLGITNCSARIVRAEPQWGNSKGRRAACEARNVSAIDTMLSMAGVFVQGTPSPFIATARDDALAETERVSQESDQPRCSARLGVMTFAMPCCIPAGSTHTRMACLCPLIPLRV